MSYKKASDILPKELIDIIQKYVDGEYIYIPRKEDNRKSWGDKTRSKNEVYERNLTIYSKYKSGISVKKLAETYYLSPNWIHRIISKLNRE
ncbi:Mor transcription activator family protein [Natranaerovirga pectinivora]|uniref:Mor transcription activator family protein n=1 Tax=Natranaerovirga pectinivora TaxID=682400 RepID=A0A4R3MML6_9FIRM|nr:CD3324 family protein [Natranaerovirga pectinivora]TCT16203.1 Mor transcription activator family protein [Natranaerovirga pectinivora]